MADKSLHGEKVVGGEFQKNKNINESQSIIDNMIKAEKSGKK